MTERSAQKKAARQAARARGKCGQCHSRPVPKGAFRCDVCLANNRRRYAEIGAPQHCAPWLSCCLIAGRVHRADCHERVAAPYLEAWRKAA
jgi:hypothetical protein